MTLLVFVHSLAAHPRSISLSDTEALAIGKMIWKNECGGKVEGLVWWNPGEEFASLGIGHFIWYPKNYHGPFDESFPLLLTYLVQQGITLPKWLHPKLDCPWSSYDEFQKNKNNPQVQELRQFLAQHVALQARFAANRLEAALPRLLASISESQQQAVEQQFWRVAQSPYGFYPLMDYVNFKGEGVSSKERYHGQGWGLLQVLEKMKGTETGLAARREFAEAADFVLTQRVKNSPPERKESRWLAGWRNRIATYYSQSY